MKRKSVALGMVFLLLTQMFSGCGKKSTDVNSDERTPVVVTDQEVKNDLLVNADPVTLTIAGPWEDCRAIEEIGRLFTQKYPNCTVEYEFLQDDYASVQKRMEGDEKIDLFISHNLTDEYELYAYTIDFFAEDSLDFSNTFEGLITNFTFHDENLEKDVLACVPLGAEMRGMFVNVSLLNSLNIDVPTDQESLLNACRILKANGYIPFQGNPGSFSQTLIYPWICNTIANADNYQELYNRIENRDAGLSGIFSEQFEFMYKLIEEDYYDYKYYQTEYGLFVSSTSEDYAHYFFNIFDENGTLVQRDGNGLVAFMPAALSLSDLMQKTQEDYHSSIEYQFIPAPVGEEGGFVYLSPAQGLAGNKYSDHKDWIIEFLNFLFTPKYNELFAEKFCIIPNTKDAFSYISSLYDVPSNRISHLGQVTFTTGFYNYIVDALTEISKGNNPKYMQTKEDNSVALYPFSYYFEKLEEALSGQ